MLYCRTAKIPALRVWCVLGGPTPKPGGVSKPCMARTPRCTSAGKPHVDASRSRLVLQCKHILRLPSGSPLLCNDAGPNERQLYKRHPAGMDTRVRTVRARKDTRGQLSIGRRRKGVRIEWPVRRTLQQLMLPQSPLSASPDPFSN